MLVALGTWLLACLAWFALLGVENASTSPCYFDDGPRPGDSSNWLSGEERWRWVPPGTECRYEIDGRIHIDEPPTARLGIALVLVAWPLTIGVVAAATRQR
jgi:hypothetical protein